jgi:hypothetical protein
METQGNLRSPASANALAFRSLASTRTRPCDGLPAGRVPRFPLNHHAEDSAFIVAETQVGWSVSFHRFLRRSFSFLSPMVLSRRGASRAFEKPRREAVGTFSGVSCWFLPMNLLSPSLSSAPSGGEGVRRTGEEAARFMGARCEEIRGSLCRKLCRGIGLQNRLSWRGFAQEFATPCGVQRSCIAYPTKQNALLRRALG